MPPLEKLELRRAWVGSREIVGVMRCGIIHGFSSQVRQTHRVMKRRARIRRPSIICNVAPHRCVACQAVWAEMPSNGARSLRLRLRLCSRTGAAPPEQALQNGELVEERDLPLLLRRLLHLLQHRGGAEAPVGHVEHADAPGPCRSGDVRLFLSDVACSPCHHMLAKGQTGGSRYGCYARGCCHFRRVGEAAGQSLNQFPVASAARHVLLPAVKDHLSRRLIHRPNL